MSSNERNSTKPKFIKVDQSTFGRFPSPGGGPDVSREPSRSSVIELELTPAIPPNQPLTPEASWAANPTETESGWPDEVRKICEQHGLERWHRTFSTGVESSTDANLIASPENRSDPLDRFVTLYFPKEAETDRIARDMQNLPSVTRAVVIPKLVPPVSHEPLLGDTDQLTNTICDENGCLQNQWYIFRCKAHQAWQVTASDGSTLTGKGVILAAIDWGVNVHHEEVEGRIKKKMNTIAGQSGVSNGGHTGHGTAVLGLAGASHNNKGMAGFAPEAELWAIQAGSDGPTDHTAWANAIKQVCEEPAPNKRKVIILEVQTENFGNIEMIPSINAAIRNAIDSQVVVCVAAGNGGRDCGVADDHVTIIPETGSILVGATDYDAGANRPGMFSNRGERITIYAPGDTNHDVTCGPRRGTYMNEFGGTSGATPKVAGTIALMLQANPELSHAAIREILKQTGTLVTDDPTGRFLDSEASAQEALRRAQAVPVPAPLGDGAAAEVAS